MVMQNTVSDFNTWCITEANFEGRPETATYYDPKVLDNLISKINLLLAYYVSVNSLKPDCTSVTNFDVDI